MAAVRALFTPVRVVCQNTLSAALGSTKNSVSIKHTKNVKNKLDQAHLVLAQADTYWVKVQESLKFMASKQMSRDEVKTFLKKLFPGKKLLNSDETVDNDSKRTENLRANIERLFDGQATGSELAGKSRWGMLNAVTHYIDHEREGRERKNGQEVSKWENSVLGLGADLRQTAFDLLLV